MAGLACEFGGGGQSSVFFFLSGIGFMHWHRRKFDFFGGTAFTIGANEDLPLHSAPESAKFN